MSLSTAHLQENGDASKPTANHEPDADPRPEQQTSQTADTGIQSSSQELRKEGNRTFTMRELLSELKSDEGDDSATPDRYGSNLQF